MNYSLVSMRRFVTVLLGLLVALTALDVTVSVRMAWADTANSNKSKTQKTVAVPKETVSHSKPSNLNSEEMAQKLFEEFVADWMKKLEHINVTNRSKPQIQAVEGGYSCCYINYGPDREFWIKRTDSPLTPFVGFLRYSEKTLQKYGKTQEEVLKDVGKVVAETPVTEIFRYTKGKWVY
jgi:hypothetical protein